MVSNELAGPHPTQKDREGGTKKGVDDPEKVLTSEDEFPDGGLRAWAVVMGVGLCLSLKDPTEVIVGCVLYQLSASSMLGVHDEALLPYRDDYNFTPTEFPSVLSGCLTALNFPVNDVRPFFPPETKL